MSLEEAGKGVVAASDKASATGPSPYGCWHFLRDFSNGVFSLLNSGKIYPTFGLLIIILAGIIAWRVPESEIAGLVSEFFSLFKETFSLLFLLVISNAGWMYLMRKLRSIYQAEIDRLAEVRNELLRGKDNIKPLTVHHTSSGDQRESYIVPGSDELTDRG